MNCYNRQCLVFMMLATVLVVVEQRSLNRNTMGSSEQEKKSHVIIRDQDTKPHITSASKEKQSWKDKMMKKIEDTIKENDKNEGSGDEDEDTGDFDTDQASGSGEIINIPLMPFLYPNSTVDADAARQDEVRTRDSNTVKGTWTLSCPSPCSQKCAPSCTPQCCIDNFEMSPPIPDNVQDMYLCPSYCATSSCAESCPSYCCTLPTVMSGSLNKEEDTQQPLPCSGYCSNYSPDNCPGTCRFECCTAARQPLPTTPSVYGALPNNLMGMGNQNDVDICRTFCSTPQMCSTNPFCIPKCCSKY